MSEEISEINNEPPRVYVILIKIINVKTRSSSFWEELLDFRLVLRPNLRYF